MAADLFQRLQCRGSLERRPAGQQFVQDYAQGVHIRGRTDVLATAFRLLGRHVTGCADENAGARQVHIRIQLLGETEVGNLWDESVVRSPWSVAAGFSLGGPPQAEACGYGLSTTDDG